MPHDSKGKKIDHGDYIIASVWYRANKNDILKVLGVNQGDTCNVSATAQGIPAIITVNAKDCEVILKGDGSRVVAD